MRANGDRAILLVALAPCLGLLAGCASSDECGKCGPECEVSSTTPVAWTEQTILGSPEQAFASFVGTCQAPFEWDASAWSGALTITPPQGQSTLSATVVLDTASARLVVHTSAACPDKLEIDGTATLELPEGKVARQQPFTISASPGVGPSTVGFTVREEDFGPWVSIQKSDPSSTLSMPITVTPLGRACSGRVGLSSLTVQDNMGSGFRGPFASWSDTGCEVGQISVSLTQPHQGIDVAAALATAFGQATMSGTWSDGSTTTLALTASTSATMACADTLSNGFTVVTVPVAVVASTADGRVQGLSGAGYIRVSVNQTSLWNLELNLSTDLTCGTEADVLPFTAASCMSDRQVTAQLHVNRYMDSQTTDGGSLEFYVYERQSPNASTGEADRVDRLTLGSWPNLEK